MSAAQSFSKIAVIGAGTMGSGIAAQIANAGLPVLLLDLP
ncbi:MAG: 3-hydroxyacyl-CoA dehydrogenase NAD-binding domain-containing protein, partial [Candidatus Puniceispirillaceae bacterium]